MIYDRRSILRASAGVAAFAFSNRFAFAQDTGISQMLIDSAKKDGNLNVITLPRDWANYGVLMDNFSSRYGIKIDDANPDGSSAQELQAIRSLKGQSRAPDVCDLGPSFADIGTKEKLFQPYKVATWSTIPDDVKDANGMWYGDYFGVVSFATNTGVAKDVPKSWSDLLKPGYKGMVALNGNPLGAGAAFGAVFAAALGNGGSFDNIEPGVEFFGKLAQAGNYNPVAAGPATLIGGQTPVVINWDYLSLGYKKSAAADGKAQITVALPEGATPYGNFYCQAISAYAPNPNAAKLWMEYLYSDEGQLEFLKGFAHPIRFASLVSAGKIPEDVMAQLPSPEAYKTVKFATQDQVAKAQKTLADMWPRVVKF